MGASVEQQSRLHHCPDRVWPAIGGDSDEQPACPSLAQRPSSDVQKFFLTNSFIVFVTQSLQHRRDIFSQVFFLVCSHRLPQVFRGQMVGWTATIVITWKK